MFPYKLVIAVILLSLTCHSALGIGEGSRFGLDSDNGHATTAENLLREIFQKGKNATVLIELAEPSLTNLKSLLEPDETYNQVDAVQLAIFDSTGLQDKRIYNDAGRFLATVRKLNPTGRENGESPTFHVLEDLVNSPDFRYQQVLLVTGSKPSDEDRSGPTSELLIGKKSQLSVLWSGSTYGPGSESLRQVATVTGGQLVWLSKQNGNSRGNENFEDFELLPFAEMDVDHVKRIQFPTSEHSDDKEEVLVQRMGTERAGGNIVFPLVVDVASGESLEIHPTANSRINFGVKNNLNAAIMTLFGAKLNNVPQFIQPQKVLLPPASSVTVAVNIRGNANAHVGTTSNLTFSAFLPNNYAVSRTALVSHVPQATYDRTQPDLYYKYEGDCTEYSEPQTCENGYWGAQITARDEESGILKIVSQPYALFFNPGFVAGTKDTVTAHFTTTCCQSKVDIWAEDVRGNTVKRSLDVFNQTLLAGEIAAIVVGVLLLVFIIIAIILCGVLIRRRNRRKLILPRTRAESR